MVSTPNRLVRGLRARDPGHARLVLATAISAGVLVSVVCGWVVLHQTHGSMGLLSLALFVSLQAGNLAHDPTPRQRLSTTVWFVPTVLAAMLLAHVASAVQPVAIACFVALAGLAVWLRNLGPRAASLGSLAFISFFFTLFMRPSDAEMPTMLLMGLCAVVPQVLVRVVLLGVRPQRELTLLLRELRVAAWVACDTAMQADRGGHATRGVSDPSVAGGLRRSRRVRVTLARLDAVSWAVTQWQSRFDTQRYAGCAEAELRDAVLNARVETGIAVSAVLSGSASFVGRRAASAAALHHLRGYLTSRANAPAMRNAVAWAHGIVGVRSTVAVRDSASELAATVILAHDRVQRAQDPRQHTLLPVLAPSEPGTAASAGGERRPGTASTANPVPNPAPKLTKNEAPRDARSSRALLRWRDWNTPSRMAVQAMIAAVLASAVGEAIAASRWYWAVMTAFVIFTGTTTRGAVLTRAWKRFLGTLGGVLLGSAAVFVVGTDQRVLVAVALIAVFGMLYLGPLNYLYATVCMTTMLVAMYRLLGVLDTKLLELRLEETIAGAVIGVLCAYFILSTNSRPALRAAAAQFADAYAGLLGAVREMLVAEAAGKRGAQGDTVTGAHAGLPGALHRLEAAQLNAEKVLADNRAATMLGHARSASPLSPFLAVLCRSAAQLVRSVGGLDESASRAVQGAVDVVAANAHLVWTTVRDAGGGSTPQAPRTEPTPGTELNDPETPVTSAPVWRELPIDPPKPAHSNPVDAVLRATDEAWQALQHTQWALRRLSESVAVVLTHPQVRSAPAPERVTPGTR